MMAVEKEQWERMNQELGAAQQREEEEVAQIRADARDEFRRELNITRSEPLDVTELFYREQTARSEVEQLRNQVDKLDAEIRRMREHIEQEPQRIAAAVEAAKRAFPAWRATPAVDRARVLFRLKALLDQNHSELARSLTKEHGKILQETTGEVYCSLRSVRCTRQLCLPHLNLGQYRK